MADCFFLYDEMINVSQILFSIFYAGIEENDMLFFFSWKFEIYSFEISRTAWQILLIHTVCHSLAFLKLFQIKATCSLHAVPPLKDIAAGHIHY